MTANTTAAFTAQNKILLILDFPQLKKPTIDDHNTDGFTKYVQLMMN